MDGTEGKIYEALKERNERKEKEYPCIWYGFKCPIRSKWKLAPENLVPWCSVCKQIGYLDEEKKQMKQ